MFYKRKTQKTAMNAAKFIWDGVVGLRNGFQARTEDNFETY